MIRSIPALWGRRPALTEQDQIDHALQHRNYRLIAGLSIDAGFDRVAASLVVSAGHGKYIRLRHTVEASVAIPVSLTKGCREYSEGKNNEIATFSSLLSDLAAVQAAAVERLKIEAGKYVDRILAVSVYDAGLWRNDFDGRLTYRSFCDATRLAELCGISVIDNYPAADLAASGSGFPLSPLPWWLLVADRDSRVAKCERFVLHLGQTVSLLRLPVSDGLDSELPELEYWRLEEGKLIPWTGSEFALPSRRSPTYSPASDSIDCADELIEALKQIITESSTGVITEIICCVEREPPVNFHQRIACALPSLVVKEVTSLGISSTAAPAVVAAMLGLMHIDQMPANVPWLTGAQSQRILGRLTLGRPSSWRLLLRTMADYQPAAMKLKDAV